MKLTKKQIENIIEDEIAVDAYDDDEVDSGWETYMDDNLYYPFNADCKIRRNDAEDTWEKVEVIGENTRYNNGSKTYCVDVVFSGFVFTVRLEDLREVKAEEETLRALLVWKGR